MRSLVMRAVKQPLELVESEGLKPGPGSAVVELRTAALNRRDYWITQGLYPGIRTPVVLGSDGAGIVTRLGTGTSAAWADQEVLIYPGFDWGDDPKAQNRDFRALGMPDDGTLASEIVVPAECLFAKPPHLSWEGAAALPLAGVTAYRALFTQGRCVAGDKVLITGVGGGVGSLVLQMAVAAGAQVYVTSSRREKLEQARSLGAREGFDYTVEGWSKDVAARCGSMDLTIDSAGGSGFNQLIQLASPGGRLVTYGATAGRPADVDIYKIFWKQLHVIGASMGSPDDFRKLLDFVSRHRIEPVVDRVFPLTQANEALAHMANASQFGKIVIDVNG